MIAAAEVARREGHLRGHVMAVAEKPVTWGVDDCTAWAADWIKRATGLLVEVPYRSEGEARAMIAAVGGLLPLWRDTLGAAGLYETHAPVYGDIGLVETKRHGVVGVIVSHHGVCALRSDKGVTFLRPRAFAACWSI